MCCVGTSAVHCSFCGLAASDPPPLTWISAVERDRRQWFCDSCSREHLRAMESKLDSEWW
ncbi:MAG: hypothetical protein JWP74_1015 [Marmoricola sp.]|nr:hypothetical protein [Marmoricola sp.]